MVPLPPLLLTSRGDTWQVGGALARDVARVQLPSRRHRLLGALPLGAALQPAAHEARRLEVVPRAGWQDRDRDGHGAGARAGHAVYDDRRVRDLLAQIRRVVHSESGF